MDDRNKWLRERIIAHIWFCGDDDCDCTEPAIDKIAPNLKAGYPWIRRERIWSGTYRSGADYAESQQQFRELRDACIERGLPVPEEVVERLKNEAG